MRKNLSGVTLKLEVADLLGWLRDMEISVKGHDFSYAAEMARDFELQCNRVNQIANEFADEEKEGEG